MGHTVTSDAVEPGLRLIGDGPALRRFLRHPGFRAWVARQIGGASAGATRQHGEPVVIPLTAVARHGLICGGTGGGKSRLLLHLCRLLIAIGFSVVLIDPKGDTADQFLAGLAASDLPPEAVTIFDPRRSDGVPGLNPFLAHVPAVQAATDLVALIKASATSWGPRLEDLLTNACLIIAHHRLSPDELLRFLAVPPYREALLRLRPRGPVPLWYAEARRFFIEEFGRWSPSEQVAAAGPVTNKLRETLRNSYLRPLLCARNNTLRFEQLWQQARVAVVRLDRVALGEEGSRWLAGLMTNLLFRTALRAPGPVPVALVIDELPVVEAFVGTAISQLVTMGRSQGLACLVACQHLAQISDSLRETLLANAALQTFFASARAIAV